MQNQKKGLIYSIAAFLIWGLLPVYWKLLASVNAIEILANRIIWALVILILILIWNKKWPELKTCLKNKKELLFLLISSIMIGLNWGIYIYAVVSGKILETSLGYYINPLLAVIIGVIFYKEKLNNLTKAALGIATIGVLVKALQFGQIPWLSLALAITFALYGGIKKSVKAESSLGLTIETALMAPLALAYIIYRQSIGLGAYVTENIWIILLLIGGGLATMFPLLLFSSAAKKVPMSTLGFTQYISPTIGMFLGIFIYHEQFTTGDLISFALVWLALAIYSYAISSKKSLSKNK